MLGSVGTDHGWSDSCGGAALFSEKPITAMSELAAYESLWLNEGAWFKSLAALFESNPGAVPSELVPAATIADTLAMLREYLGPDRIRRLGVRVHGSFDYPQRLRDADHPAELLYFQGNWALAETKSVAVVGTRDPSPDGIESARRIARILVKNEFTVTSGLAKGIDTAAHTAALEAGGRTIAVVGTPLFDVYPKENSDLQDRIAADHLVISQVPFLRYSRQHFKANSLFFPARNITMSALSCATVIVEAGNTSGTLVQARAALAQGRKLFILDSCFRNKNLTWPAKYEAKGAIRVERPSDIIAALQDAPAISH